MNIRWGILGTGMIAAEFSNDLTHNGHEVVAVGSRSQESAQRFAGRFGISRAHGSYEDLFADPSVDAVYVATPNPFHARHATMALEAGKHVLLEKPFALNAEEGAQVIDLARERSLVVMEAMWTRFLPHMVRIREIIAAGQLGQLSAVMADLSQSFSADENNRFNSPQLGGGALLDLGVYAVSFAVDVLGLPTAVRSLSTPVPSGVDGQTSVLLGFDGGAQAALHVAIHSRGPMTASIIGAAGRIDIDSAWHRPANFTVWDAEGNPVERFDSSVSQRGMQYEAAAFEKLVKNGTLSGDVMPHEETLGILAILDEVREQN